MDIQPQFHMCNATNGDWAYVSLLYYTSNCSLVRYDYADPYKVPVFIFYIYLVSYYFITIIIFPITLLLLYEFIKNKVNRYVAPENDALLTRHPDGYWGNMVGEGAPFGNFFRNLLRRQ
jgi:hypothetical protein